MLTRGWLGRRLREAERDVIERGAKAICSSFGWIQNYHTTIVKKPAVKGRNTPLETSTTARKRCRGKEDK